MCRIAGFADFAFNGGYDLEDTMAAMRDTMLHGGPDDEGLFLEKEKGLALGHRRLSILDLSPLGHQPLAYENLVMVYNGEVYNFREIRKELEEKSYSFQSGSDTEVILKALHAWGFEAVRRFRGMWAFAVWDRQTKCLTLCRDRVGVKPLYWYHRDGLFMFSSELKAFHKHPKFRKQIDEKALSLFLKYGYITSPYSIFRDVFKLEPGHFLVLDQNGQIRKEKYWDIEDVFRRGVQAKNGFLKMTEQEVALELEDVLTESFRLRLVSDVPVGVFLSGGIDSSILCALLQKGSPQPVKTFTIGFHEKGYDEAQFAKKVAAHLGTEHTEFYCTPREALELIPRLPELYDEPFGDSSAIPTHLVSMLARRHVKVSLSADGGDEQFAGYTRYQMVNRIYGSNLLKMAAPCFGLINPDVAYSLYSFLKPALPKWANFRDRYSKFRNVLKAGGILSSYDEANKYFLDDEVKRLSIGADAGHGFKMEHAGPMDPVSFMMLYDMKTYLPDDILVKVDRATMGIALEGREPFLDHKTLEYTSMLPLQLKNRKGASKHILKEILYKYVPRNLVDRPKQGFGIPVYEWFRADLKKLCLEYLAPARVKREGVFSQEGIRMLMDDYLANRGLNHHKLWFLLVFQMWFERWM